MLLNRQSETCQRCTQAASTLTVASALLSGARGQGHHRATGDGRYLLPHNKPGAADNQCVNIYLWFV